MRMVDINLNTKWFSDKSLIPLWSEEQCLSAPFRKQLIIWFAKNNTNWPSPDFKKT